MAFIPQNFVSQIGPAISAAFANTLDYLANSVFGGATTNPAARTALTADLPLEIANGGTAARTAAAAISALGITPAAIGAMPSVGITATESAAGASPVNLNYLPIPEDVRRYGAVDGATASITTPAVQATINALNGSAIKGGAIIFPGDANSVWNLNATIVLPPRASGSNFTTWYRIQGEGMGSSVITAQSGITAAVFNAEGTSISVLNYYREFKDLNINGNSIALYGIDMSFNQHFLIEDVFINNLTGALSAGLRVNGAISSRIHGLKVHNSAGYGILADQGSGNFFNANSIVGCSFLALGADGCYFTGGFTGSAITGSTFESCGNYGLHFAGYSATDGFVGGNYFEGNYAGDIMVGDNTYAGTLVFEGNYFNGYTGSPQLATYTPIILYYANGTIIRGNMVAQTAQAPSGYLFLNANAGGVVENCTVEHNSMTGQPSVAANQVYNLPGAWVDNNNSLIDRVYAPLIEANVLKHHFPFAGWSFSLGGSSTAARSATNIFGQPALAAIYNGGVCTLTLVVNIGAEFLGRFATFAIPVISNSTVSFGLAVTANGTGNTPNTSNLTVNPGNGVETMAYGMCYVPPNATTITIQIVLGVSASYTLGQPCLYVGATPWYSSDGDGPTVFYNSAMPTTGSWVQGDVVWNSAMAHSSPTGWARVTTGSGNVLNTDWYALASI